MLWFLAPAMPETDNIAVTYVAVLAAENCTPAFPPADSTKLVVLAVTSDGKPLMEIFTCPVNPFMGWIEMLTDAEAPGPRRIFGGLTPSVKSKFGGGGGGFPPPEFPPLVPPPHPEKKQSASKVVVRSSRDIVLLCRQPMTRGSAQKTGATSPGFLSFLALKASTEVRSPYCSLTFPQATNRHQVLQNKRLMLSERVILL